QRRIDVKPAARAAVIAAPGRGRGRTVGGALGAFELVAIDQRLGGGGRTATHAVVLALTRRGRGRHVGLGRARAGLGHRLGPGLAGLDRNDLGQLVAYRFLGLGRLGFGGAALGILALGLAAGVDLGQAPCVFLGLDALVLGGRRGFAQGGVAGLVLALGEAGRICRIEARARRLRTSARPPGALRPAAGRRAAALGLGRTRTGRADASRALFNNHRA